MTKLQISETLSLPADAVTQLQIVLGNRGMGKTNFGTVLGEELHASGLKFSFLDPKGVAWGIKYGRTRQEVGLPVLVLGGVHADMPIMPTAGSVVADLIVNEQVSTVVDISRHPSGKTWSQGEKIRFVADYCVRLYERQGEKRRPIHQIIDEAARFVPQQIMHGAVDVARCAGAVEVLAEEGRSDGIGLTLITQRSARIAKAVTELAECLVAFHTLGPLSTQAILDWFGAHVEKAKWKDYLEMLRKLPVGDALVVSPGWLKFEGVVHIRARHTYDSSATPKAGRKPAQPGRAAKVDLEMYRTLMAEAIQQAEEHDPKRVKARLADLQDRLDRTEDMLRTTTERAERLDALLSQANDDIRAHVQASKEVPVVRSADLDALRELMGTAKEAATQVGRHLSSAAHDMSEVVDRLGAQIHQAELAAENRSREVHRVEPSSLYAIGRGDLVPGSSRPDPAGKRRTEHGRLQAVAEAFDREVTSALKMGAGERRLLAAVVQHPSGCTPQQITVLTGFKRSTRNTYLQRLTKAALVVKDGGRILATREGMQEIGDTRLPTGEALRRYHLDHLPAGEASILKIVIQRYPAEVDVDEIDRTTGFQRSTRNTYIQRLKARELVERAARGAIRASAHMFA